MNTRTKNLLCILILLIVQATFSLETTTNNKLSKTSSKLSKKSKWGVHIHFNHGGYENGVYYHHHHHRGVNCHGVKRWSYKVAHGQKAPWTYAGGQEVHWKGRKYRAMWGGTETPGTHLCRTQAACSHNGWQWITLGRCRRHHHHHGHWWWRHHHRRHRGVNCHGTSRWSYKIAHGQKAPWTYAGGQEVHWKGVKYRAMWGGTETPGTHVCRTQGACSHNGWQWITLGRCRRHHHHHHHGHWWWRHHHGHHWHHHRRHRGVNCHGTSRWSYKIAHGQKAPWTYAGGQEVHWKGVKYRAMWGGTETPGTHVCRTQGACSHNGWQWITLGRCRRHHHHYYHHYYHHDDE